MAVTAHFVDDDWVLQNRTLRFLYVTHPHTSDVLASVLMDRCLFLYNLENKISSIVVDNCTTNDSMMDILLGKFDSSSLMLVGKFLHMRCSAHILNLIVKDGLEVIGSGIERIRECIAFWVATPKRYEKFEDSARFLRIQATKKIHLDCKTRWNSTYLMLDSALPYKANFERLKRMNARLNFSLPNADDWKFAEMICEKLKIFYDVTLLISGRNYPTANLLFRLICEIKLNLESWANSDVEIISGMTYRMIAKFDKYWSEMNGLLAIASILDPRNKLDCVDFYFKKIYRVEASREIQRITSLLYDLLVEYVDKRIETPITEDPIVSTPLSTSDSLFSQKGPSEGNCQDRYVAHKKTKKRRVNLKSELDHYLEEDVMPDIKQFDILDF
uniref:hAT-like transposase RNase-H fold domain-containing protein n=1 Tax=Opuntia streptacantha TaxID=393608 RepID=A0A7C9A9N4_OPUST